jgi:hypothetical protein
MEKVVVVVERGAEVVEMVSFCSMELLSVQSHRS